MLKVVWDNPQHNTLRIDYFSPIQSWEEYRAAVIEAHTMVRGVAQRVHVIHNARDVKMPTQDTTRAIEELNITINDVPQNVVLLISVTTTSLERRITRIVPQILKRADSLNFFIVDSLEAAYKLIEAFEAGEDITALV